MRYFKLLTSLALAFGLLGLGMNASAHNQGMGDYVDSIIVTRHFTGAWGQVDQESQGLSLEVIEQLDNSRKAVAYWYTYGSDRKTAWYLGVGNLVENRIELKLFDAIDVGFMQDASPGNDSVHSIGTMTVTFDSCNSGAVAFATTHEEVGSGSFDITRLTEVMNTHCSGGMSDDMHADAMFGTQRVDLLPAKDGITGSGYASYEAFPGRIEFEVEVNGLPDGDYHLSVGAQDRGPFIVNQGHGELEFTSPGEIGSMLLNFDPRGMQIEIHDASSTVLSSFDVTLEADDHHNGGMEGHDDDHYYDCQYGSGYGHGMGMGMGGMHNCVENGEYADIQVDLENTGAIPAATGKAEWDMNTTRVQFSVEIENVPVGPYTLNVGGVDVGVIEVLQMHFGVFGHISFRDPPNYGMRHLDFEPRGEMIKVIQGGNVILEIEFPTE